MTTKITRALIADDILDGIDAAVSQGNVPDYPSVVGLASLPVPAGMQSIRVKGYYEASDGGGGIAIDQDNGTEPWFVSGGDTARNWYLAKGQVITPSMFGASPANSSAENIVAFQKAEAISDVIYVPEGTFQLTTPMALGYTKQYYGAGVLRFDNAEWWRRGGSSGSVEEPERYTLFYEFDSESDVSVTFDGVVQDITWLDAFTVIAPGSTTATAVIINIANGRLRLGSAPESVRSYNTFLSGGGKIAPEFTTPTQVPVPGMMNYSSGSRSLQNLTTGSNNTAVGARVLTSLETGENNTGMGFQALYRAKGNGNTAVGSIAGEWITTGNWNTAHGGGALGGITTGNANTGIGYQALAEAQAVNNNTAVGFRANGNPGGGATFENCVAVGAFAMDFNQGSSNTGIGYRALNGDGGFLTGNDNVGVGAFVGRRLSTGSFNVLMGALTGGLMTTASNCVGLGFGTLAANVSISELTAVGYQSLATNTGGVRNTGLGFKTLSANQTGNDNTAVGWDALVSATGSGNTALGSRSQEANTTGVNNTTVGFEAGRFITTGGGNALIGYRAGRSLTTGSDNTAIGQDALQFEVSGINNTAVGRSALRLFQDGTNMTGVSNSTGVGNDARVSGSNQVQIGNSATTTYVYGTVQNRSDERDKADIRDTELGIDFIMALRPVDYRWDMREDYIDVDPETGKVKRHKKDGSRKRTRFHHGFIAQEVQKSGFDFGGLQDHSINGGNDVLSIGHDELLAPLVKTVQTIVQRLEQLEKAA